MTRTLITGMSATGKSTVVRRLAGLGHLAVDLDAPAWSQTVLDEEGEPDWCWREDAVRTLLEGQDEVFVSGTSTHQGRLYPLLDHVVLLSVPTPVARRRLRTRTTNAYGKDRAELDRELRLRREVEPLLRAGSCLEVDTSRCPAAETAVRVVAHARGPGCPPRPGLVA